MIYNNSVQFLCSYLRHNPGLTLVTVRAVVPLGARCTYLGAEIQLHSSSDGCK